MIVSASSIGVVSSEGTKECVVERVAGRDGQGVTVPWERSSVLVTQVRHAMPDRDREGRADGPLNPLNTLQAVSQVSLHYSNVGFPIFESMSMTISSCSSNAMSTTNILFG